VLKTFKYLGTTLLFLLVLVFILPFFINLNSYKGKIGEEVLKLTGRHLTIAGDLRFRILPRPFIRLEKVQLSSVPGAQKPEMIKVDEVEVTLAALPLLVGKIVVATIELQKPEITFERISTGQANWEFPFLKDLKSAESNTSQPSSPTGTKSSIHIQHVLLKEGTLRYIDATSTVAFNDIGLDVYLENLSGPIDFDLTFKAFDKDVNIVGTIKEIGKTIPVEATLKALGEKVKISGHFDTNTTVFNGALKLKGNLTHLKHVFPTLDLPEGLKAEYKLAANLITDTQGATLQNLAFSIGEIKASGQGKFNFKQMTGSVALDLSPGRVHLEFYPAKAQQGAISGKVVLVARNLEDFLKAVRIPTKDLPEFLENDFSFSTILHSQGKTLSFKDLSLTMKEATLSGDVSLKNWDQKGVYTFNLKTNNVAVLAALGKVELPSTLGPAALKGEAQGALTHLNATISFLVASARGHLQGSFTFDKGFKTDIEVALSGSSLKATLSHLGTSSPSASLGQFSFKVNLKGDPHRLIEATLQKSTLLVGREEIELQGSASLTLGGAKPKIRTTLSVSSLNLDRLMASLSNQNIPDKRFILVSRKTPKPSLETTHIPWTHNKIDLSFLRSFDGDIEISMPRVQKGSLVFDSVHLKAHVANGIMEITSLTGGLYGGKVAAHARLSSQKEQPITLSATLKGAQLKNIVPEQKSIKVVKGLFNLSTDLSTAGHSQYQYVSNLSGSLHFNGSQGTISGFNVQKVVKELNGVKNIGSAIHLLDASFSGGETQFNKIEATASLKGGVATLTHFLLEAVGAKVTATGKINLPKYWMEVEGDVQLDVKGIPAFQVLLFGPLNNPQNKLKTTALKKYLMENVISGVVQSLSKGKPQDILKSIIGIGGNNQGNGSPAPADTQPDTGKMTPEKAIGNILKGLF
jgi:uncharacterized protein involved in outer membrane biogenesis